MRNSSNTTNSGYLVKERLVSNVVGVVLKQEEEFEEEEEEQVRKPSSLAELKRKQTTAVVLLGVIGAEFGQDITSENNRRKAEDRRKSSIVEGFGRLQYKF